MSQITRDQIKKEDKWDLSPMYSTVEDWEKDFSKVQESLPGFSQFVGKLNERGLILEALKYWAEIYRLVDKVYTWASLKNSEDLSSKETTIWGQRCQKLYSEFSAATSFYEPELGQLSDDFLDELIEDPEFADHVMDFKRIKRKKKHILSDKEEKLLANAGNIWSGPYDIFSSFDNIDADFGMITDENGDEVHLTHGNYATLLEKKDRSVREKAFEAVYETYKSNIHSLADTLNLKVKQGVFFSEVRGYDSPLEKALFSKNIDTGVYKGLIKAVNDKLENFYPYISKRAGKLGLDKLNMWDLRVALLDVDFKISFDEAIELVVEASKPMGEEYTQILEDGLRKGWVDKYENKGKRSGAFSGGCYDSWPYILMNYDGTLNDLYTLMHEAGHSMHSYLARKNQCHNLAGYPIFTAEIASTVNERLLTDCLLKKFDGDKRNAVLHYEIDAIRATFFRQTMFAEFELLIYETVQKGMPLTKDFLCEEYKKMNDKYYGPDMGEDEFVQYEWARIPHFYYDFYVYQYATGIAAAYHFARVILDGSPEKYLELLKSGGKDFPLDLLKKAGLDMTSAELYDPIFARFEDLVEGI